MNNINTSKQVVITNPSIDEYEGDTVIRGILSPESLENLRIDRYQREQMTPKKIANLAKAFVSKESIPDIDISERRKDFGVDNHGNVVLSGPVYIVDGQQRRAGALKALDEGFSPRLGAVVFLGKTKEWEKKRFLVLNLTQTRVSPSVILRNLKEENPGVRNLWYLSTTDESFFMKDRISWDQYMAKGQLLRATAFIGVAIQLHRHLITRNETSNACSGAERLASSVNRVFEAMDCSDCLRKNITTFFKTVDNAYNIRDITYVSSAAHIKGTFLVTLAEVFSSHENFWRDKELVIDRRTIERLSKFNLFEPTIANLISNSSGNSVNRTLLSFIINHINHGRRSGRLKPRYLAAYMPEEDLEEEVNDL